MTIKQAEITKQIFRDAFHRILGQMDDIEKYEVSEGADALTISVHFKGNSYEHYYRASGVYSIEEMLRNANIQR